MCVVIWSIVKWRQFVSHVKSFVLIEMVQAEECLWDMRCACYHDRNRKRRVMDEIAEKLQLSGKCVLLILETTLVPPLPPAIH